MTQINQAEWNSFSESTSGKIARDIAEAKRRDHERYLANKRQHEQDLAEANANAVVTGPKFSRRSEGNVRSIANTGPAKLTERGNNKPVEYAYRDFEDMDDAEQEEFMRQVNEIADIVDSQAPNSIVDPPPPNSG